MNLKQFKLTNDDEIICEVMEIEPESGEVIIRKALRIICAEDFDNSLRYYSFRPYMSFSDSFDEIIVLNSGHIISESSPSTKLMIHYNIALKEVQNTMDVTQDLDLDEISKAASGMDEDEFQEYMAETIAKLKEEASTASEEMLDSGNPNIIQFKPKGTVH